NPQHNSFLLAPLAKEAGGTERCGDAVFRSTGDADYQKILKTFEAVQAEVTRAPRWDINPDNVPPPATCPP
ncbi:MAG: hypothetical protein MI741_12625, partial [Rhodospirillales bacterium]|nr:hypothetical protein [Rhodospirillales bacterium]